MTPGVSFVAVGELARMIDPYVLSESVVSASGMVTPMFAATSSESPAWKEATWRLATENDCGVTLIGR